MFSWAYWRPKKREIFGTLLPDYSHVAKALQPMDFKLLITIPTVEMLDQLRILQMNAQSEGERLAVDNERCCKCPRDGMNTECRNASVIE